MKTPRPFTPKQLARRYLTQIAETGPTPGYRRGGAEALAYLVALESVARAAGRAVPVLNNGAAGLAEAGYEQTSVEVRAESDRLDRSLARASRAAKGDGGNEGGEA